MMGEEGYSACDLYHWLIWRIRCLESTGMEFQGLFEAVMEKLEPGRFVRIKPRGSLGDKKSDGFLLGDGTLFQVYAPEQITLDKLLSKAHDDLEGAKEHWKDELTKWVFVCNISRSRGVGADVAQLLERLKKENPQLEIAYLTDYGIWDKLKSLSPDVRNEILGAPFEGFEQVLIPQINLPDANIPGLSESRIVILHENIDLANLDDVYQALKPQLPFGPTLRLRPAVDKLGWNGAAQFQKQQLDDLIAHTTDHLARFAVFPLSEIPLLIHLGYVLGDSKDVELYQYHRDNSTWDWPQDDRDEEDDLIISGEPDSTITEDVEVCIRLSLSAVIQPDLTSDIMGKPPIEIDIAASDPTRNWLNSHGQLVALRKMFREVIDRLITHVPTCTRIHVFYAGPASGAVAVGQSINPRMTPPIQLYEYDRNTHPRYQPVLQLPLNI